MKWPDAAVRVRAPATSANLGPGFDSLGLALARHDIVEARVRPGGLAIEVSGAGEELAGAGERHLVVCGMRAGFAAFGGQPPGLEVRCHNSIPQGYGMGSSAAAIVAGLLAARALIEQIAAAEGQPGGPRVLPDGLILRLAARMEGHPDNAAACLGGGLTISWTAAEGARFTRLEPAAGLCPVICLPSRPMATSAARKVLPPAVPHADAAANAARSALLVAAVTARPELLMDATEDFLHQSYRAAAMPDTATLIAALRSAGVPAVISGAGPSVLALTLAGREPGPYAVADIAAGCPGGWKVLPLAVDRDGAAITPVTAAPRQSAGRRPGPGPA